jgi:hypothetical protein
MFILHPDHDQLRPGMLNRQIKSSCVKLELRSSHAPLHFARVLPHLILSEHIAPPLPIDALPTRYSSTVPRERHPQPVLLCIHHGRDGAGARVGRLGLSGEDVRGRDDLGVRIGGLDRLGRKDGEQRDGCLTDVFVEL